MKKILLIDVFALLHRAYHALPRLTTPAGEPIGAVYGFTSLLLKALRELRPDSVIAALDLPEPTFRQKEFPTYQATRPETPSDLALQIEKIRELLEAFGISVYGVPTFEADDVIGSLATALTEDPKIAVIILTGDLDALQLIQPHVVVYTLKKGLSETTVFDKDAFQARYGFLPELLPDYKGLAGDASDNIPGVPGIGKVTAQKLIQKFGTLEDLYKAIESAKATDLSSSVIKKLSGAREHAFLSKRLATIRKDVPLGTGAAHPPARAQGIPEAAKTLFSRWGFKALLSRLDAQRQLEFGGR